jgi:hypothetical protein
MNILILSDKEDNFRKIIAEGLHKMLNKVGIQSKIWYDGLFFLDHELRPAQISFSTPKAAVKSIFHLANPPMKAYFKQKWKELASYDLIIVVETIPTAYLKYHLTRIEEIRQKLPNIPIVLYDVNYLGTCGEWIGFLKHGNDYHGFIKGSGHYGLERYDWQLVTSASTDFPLPKGFQPVTEIGCHLNDGSLYPEQDGRFVALIDFERPNHMHERAIQILALEKTNTPYKVLHGRYPIAEIRKIYRQTAIYFISHLEAFGLPIVELQACGSLVFTPYARWAWGHYHKPDLTQAGSGPLSPNFVVYNNDLDTLCQKIEEAKANFNPQRVLETFKKRDNRFWEGDLSALQTFIDKVKSGEIHSKLHKEFTQLNEKIVQSL